MPKHKKSSWGRTSTKEGALQWGKTTTHHSNRLRRLTRGQEIYISPEADLCSLLCRLSVRHSNQCQTHRACIGNYSEPDSYS